MTLNFEDYVRGVYYLQRKLGFAKSTDLARRLKVSKNTVSLMVQKLSIRKLLRHRPYGEVELTPAGEKLAKNLTYRHRLIELFLTEKLGVPAEKVHQEACRLEHDFSKKSIQSIARMLDYPRVDPHGKPLKE
ncbi:MAG TPA: metal-dependent transcriptional regulator [Candidatus Norongarragalinales archaeon]|nr:metal-dependent transcriptional regulator [Candidatus Norongarragalinales archaeon]